MFHFAASATPGTFDPLLIALASGMGGVALTVLVGVIGAVIQGQREHRRWQRDQRLKSYGDFIAATDNFLGAAQRGDVAELPTVARDSLTASAIVRLLGPDEVYEAALKLQQCTKASVRAFEDGGANLDLSEDDRLRARDEFVKLARAKTRMSH